MYKKGSVVYRQVRQESHPVNSFGSPGLIHIFSFLWYIVSVGGAKTNTAGRNGVYAGRKDVEIAPGQTSQVASEGSGGGWTCRYYQGWFLGEKALDFVE